jgi:hypothetical protein
MASEEIKAEKEYKKKSARTATDIQRSKLDKLMKNPEKPVHIPEQRQAKDPNKAPEFVYNVMGSSAGAGSGEFHVYRQIRRKEHTRQKIMDDQKNADDLNEDFQAKVEENESLSAEKTAKKRAKRQQKKKNAKKNKQSKKNVKKVDSESSEKDDDNDEKSEEDNSKKSEVESKE